MTKIEIIKKVIEAKQKEVLELDTKRREVEQAANDEFTKMFKKYFGECLTRTELSTLEDKIEVDENRCYFKRFDTEANYYKELISIRIAYKNWKEQEGDSIETSFYSTSDNSEFELNRMIMIGNIAQIILDFQDDIIAEFNSIKDNFKGEVSELNQKVWDLEKRIRDMKSEVSSIEDRDLMKKVEKEGIEFEVDESKLYRLPGLDIRWDWIVEQIKKIKVTDKTKSGKSANVELTCLYKTWDSVKQEYVLEENSRTYENVRMYKIENLVTYNKEIIVKNTSTPVEA